jgi:tol-pal system protein YbgF
MAAIRYMLLLVALFAAIFIMGCGGSEETMHEGEEATEQEGTERLGEEPPKKEDPNQAALSSFIGAEPKKEQPVKKEEPPAPPPSATMEMQRQIDDLRAENTSLKQKIVKLEQDNRSLTARLADTEAKLLAEKERADKALESARTVATRGGQVTEASAPAPAPASPSTAITKPTAASAVSYNEALKMFKAKNYDGVINSLQSLIDGGISDDLKDNCYYWKGESYFAKRNYAEAIKNFEKVLQFKKSEKQADAQFMIAQSYDRMGNKAKAKEAYEKVVKDYPTSGKVQRAKERWAKL